MEKGSYCVEPRLTITLQVRNQREKPSTVFFIHSLVPGGPIMQTSVGTVKFRGGGQADVEYMIE